MIPVTVTAQDTLRGLRPAEPIRQAPKPRAVPATTLKSQTAGRQLRWRKSDQVAPEVAEPAAVVTNATPPSASTVRLTTGTVQSVPTPGRSNDVQTPHTNVLRATYTQGPIGDGSLPPRQRDNAAAPTASNNPWNDPFGDGSKLTRTTPTLQAQPAQPPANGDGFSVPDVEVQLPGDTGTADGFSLPEALAPPEAETPAPELSIPGPLVPEPVAPTPQSADEPNDDAAELMPPRQVSPPPTIATPFGENNPVDNSPSDQANDLPPSVTELDESFFPEDKPKSEMSCDELRERIANRTIRQVSLDISPPFRPDLLAKDDYQREQVAFLEGQVDRDWRNVSGEKVAEGRLIDLAYEKAIIKTPTGEERRLRLADLSEADLAHINEAWGLPTECRLPYVDYKPRNWLPICMTWKASNLCHKPLYFEEVNLERYGHTAGPFAQPLVSTAHFFVNIAVLPYKVGIHPPTECQYALGYYRPGNCAPWIIPPVPISLRGALTEAAVIGGGIGIIP